MPAASTRCWWPSPTCRAGCRASGCTPGTSSTRWPSHGTEGCNYLLAVDVDMNTVDGYACRRGTRGYGDFVMQPDFATLRRPVARPAPRWCRPTCCGTTAPRARQSPRQVLRRNRSTDSPMPGCGAFAGTELEFIVVRRHLRSRRGTQGYRGPDPGQPVQRRLLDPRHVPGRAAAAPHPATTWTARGCTSESVKGECNLGQHEIAFKYADALTTCDNHVDLQDRRQGDRRPGRHARSPSWPSTTSARATPATSTCPLRGDDGAMVLADEADPRRAVGAGRGRSSPGQLAHMRELTLLFAPEHQLLQALRPRLVRPDRDRVGPGQPHLRAAAGRARRSPCGWRTGCPAATSTPTSRWPP